VHPAVAWWPARSPTRHNDNPHHPVDPRINDRRSEKGMEKNLSVILQSRRPSIRTDRSACIVFLLIQAIGLICFKRPDGSLYPTCAIASGCTGCSVGLVIF
jgi:hypothetical protein